VTILDLSSANLFKRDMDHLRLLKYPVESQLQNLEGKHKLLYHELRHHPPP